MKFITSLLLLMSLLCCGCSGSDSSEKDRLRQLNQKGEFIYRVADEYLFVPPAPLPQLQQPYPWEIGLNGKHPKITKEFFRCKGSSLNSPVTLQNSSEMERHFDCGGSEKHSLPLSEGKEFIYPILMDLLNYLQTKKGKRVVITCGHRCPEHNLYSDPFPSNQYSKHMLGAEVSFYVQGMEECPEEVVKNIQAYYKENSTYAAQKEFTDFQRWEKNDTNVTTLPWYNKEIFIKLFKKKEGRNFDNRHPYPYISIQVRYDRQTGQKVVYSWQQANQNFLRK